MSSLADAGGRSAQTCTSLATGVHVTLQTIVLVCDSSISSSQWGPMTVGGMANVETKGWLDGLARMEELLAKAGPFVGRQEWFLSFLLRDERVDGQD